MCAARSSPCARARPDHALQVNGVEALTLWAGGTEHTGWAEDGRVRPFAVPLQPTRSLTRSVGIQALVLNSAYDVVYNTTSRASTGTDFHEFSVPAGTNAATAVVNSYIPVHADLTSVGGISDGYILESHFEEYVGHSCGAFLAWEKLIHMRQNGHRVRPGVVRVERKHACRFCGLIHITQ